MAEVGLVGLVRFAHVAHEVAEAVLPSYRSKYSKHLFTQPALLAILCLMRYEDWTFREAEVRLVGRPGLPAMAPLSDTGSIMAHRHSQTTRPETELVSLLFIGMQHPAQQLPSPDVRRSHTGATIGLPTSSAYWPGGVTLPLRACPNCFKVIDADDTMGYCPYCGTAYPGTHGAKSAASGSSNTILFWTVSAYLVAFIVAVGLVALIWWLSQATLPG